MKQETIFLVLVALVGGVFLFNTFLQFQLAGQITELAAPTGYVISNQTNTSTNAASTPTTNPSTGSTPAQLNEIDKYIPKGVPDVYGQELGVSFDKPVESLAILGGLDKDMMDSFDQAKEQGRISQANYDKAAAKYSNGISFAGLPDEHKDHYIKIGSSIACEFCCGAKTMVQQNGMPACGCEHSAAMRGLAKYLVTKHPEMPDEKIMEELTKWKTIFFPKQMVARLAAGNTQYTVNDLPQQVGGC